MERAVFPQVSDDFLAFYIRSVITIKNCSNKDFRSECNFYTVNEVFYLCRIKSIQRYHSKFRSGRTWFLPSLRAN